VHEMLTKGGEKSIWAISRLVARVVALSDELVHQLRGWKWEWA